jgi:hypothetical protein
MGHAASVACTGLAQAPFFCFIFFFFFFCPRGISPGPAHLSPKTAQQIPAQTPFQIFV